jgi:hypothetical protein
MRVDARGRRPVAARGLSLVLAAGVAGLLVAGCGGGELSKADYLKEVKAINQKFADTVEKTFSSPELQNPSDLSKAADIIRQGADQLRDGAGELDGLNSPSEVESSHDKLVSGLNAFADDLDKFANAAASGNISELQSFAQQIAGQNLPSMTQVQSAIDEFKAKG